MQPLTQIVLLFGDQNDQFVDGIDYIHIQAEHKLWLRTFLADTVAAVHDEIGQWEHALRETMGGFRTIQELSDKFRVKGDDIGMAHGLLIFVMRQALLLL